MPEPKSRFLDKILEPKGADEGKAFTSERQLTAQAFNFHVEKRDRRYAEGFAWSHYVGYRWTDEGEHEKLVVIFGERVVEIEGHNLKILVDEICEGQLKSIREMVTAHADLKVANADTGPVITSVKIYPDFEEILKEIKGGDEHNTGFARKVRGR